MNKKYRGTQTGRGGSQYRPRAEGPGKANVAAGAQESCSMENRQMRTQMSRDVATASNES